MVTKKRNVMSITGTILLVVGVLSSIPSYISENYVIAIIGTILTVIGIYVLAIAWAD